MNKFLLSLFIFGIFILAVGSVIATPSGGNATKVSSTSAGATSPTSDEAVAGNITLLTVSGDSSTQTWQGYFGNVSGTIQLADASDNVLYNWSQATAQGEVYAANHSSVSWTNIECFNYSSTTEMNLSTLEANFSIGVSDLDGVDETFNLNNHAEFETGSVSFSSGECNNTKLFDSTGAGSFDEVLLYDNSNDIPVFAALLSDNSDGYDGNTQDFEMLVLEDGHATDTATTLYYFYVELG